MRRRLSVCMLDFNRPPYALHGPFSSYEYLSCVLSELGVEVHVFTAALQRDNLPEEETVRGVRIYRVTIPTRRNKFHEGIVLFNIKCLRYMKDLHNCDLVHAAWGYEGLGYALMKFLHKKPLVSTFHDVYWGRRLLVSRSFKERLLMLWLGAKDLPVARLSNSVIAISRSVSRDLVSSFGVYPSRLSLIPLGVATNIFRPNVIQSDLVRRFKEKGGPIILFAGELIWWKGIELMISAMPKIARTVKNAQLVIAGPTRGAYLRKLMRLVRKLKLGERVTFLGKVYGSDMISLFSNCDLYVHPVLYMTASTALTEALACGRVVVASNLSDVRDVIKHETNGLLFPKGDVDALSRVIIRGLKDEELRLKLMKNARRTAVEKYNWTKIGLRTREVYEKVLAI